MINSGCEKHRLGKFLYRFRENPYYNLQKSPYLCSRNQKDDGIDDDSGI